MIRLSPSQISALALYLAVAMFGGSAARAQSFDRTDYGQRIEGVAGGTDVWWCEAAWKVSRSRPAPKETSAAASLAAARDDREAVQIVLRPKQDLKQLTATIESLRGPDGATIPAREIQVLRVYYHFVHTPTDRTGTRDWWPDALPPLDAPLDLTAQQNQPLWLLVHVPRDARPGDYAGHLNLKATGWSARVPVRLHVWNFALPEHNHMATAFGLPVDMIFRYHRLKSEADKRRVLDLYFQSFAEHRISPYDPTPLDPIRVKFLPEAAPPRTEVDFSAFDPAMQRAVVRYRFTNFGLQLQGMPEGNSDAHSQAKIGRFGPETPEYQAMFASYLKQLESHLRAKGWLSMLFTYWFDEPQPKDYAFVRAGMERIKRCAPGLATMVPLNGDRPEEALAGAIDIWCPITPNYRHDVAQQRRAHGERYWWYICCAPKVPYCTLFIDHPATELRVWLWQTWQRDITGVLVWNTDYWTSRPDAPQDPYADPMSYVYLSKPEQKNCWGNGDGRFLYPPLRAMRPDALDRPVLDPPVSSIRWEMLREGIEDYEYLWLLRDLINKRRPSLTAEQTRQYESLLAVPEAITRDATTFTTDPRPVYARRAAIAEAIEQLAK
jgi:hypothetical protein